MEHVLHTRHVAKHFKYSLFLHSKPQRSCLPHFKIKKLRLSENIQLLNVNWYSCQGLFDSQRAHDPNHHELL